MRDLARGCLVWFVGFPLSVVVATAVLTAPVWITADRPLDSAVALMRSAGPVVALFSFPAAVWTAPSSSVLHYAAAGIRTGAWCAVLAFSLYIIVLIAAAVGQLHRLLASGSVAEDVLQGFAMSAGVLAVAVGVFAIAGGLGGFVFGLVAVEDRS